VRFLRRPGWDYSDVVRAQTYLTDMADFPKFSAVRDRYFGSAKPASTLLEVKGLAHVGCCVEVEVTAIR
jgi:2-iminobutanoate/2-iminopropanoate deaminase